MNKEQIKKTLKEYYKEIDSCCIETKGRDYAIHSLLKEFPEEIVNLAFEAWCEDSFDGRVYISPEGEFTTSTLTSNSYRHPDDPDIQIYSLSGNWVANNPFQVGDILEDVEYEKLQNITGEDDPDYLSSELLEKIDVDLDERLKEYLIWLIENNYFNG